MAERQLWTLEPCGLRLPPELTLEEWAQVGQQLGSMARVTPWSVGDWLLYGEARGDWGEAMSQAIESTGLEWSTISNWRWVCRSYPGGARHPRLSFTHHLLVAGLEPEAREAWLQRSEAAGWTAIQLRQELAASRRRPAASRLAGPSEAAQEVIVPQAGPVDFAKRVYLALTEDQRRQFQEWLAQGAPP